MREQKIGYLVGCEGELGWRMDSYKTARFVDT